MASFRFFSRKTHSEGVSSGPQQLLVFDLAIEFTEVAMLFPIEVRDPDQCAVTVDDVVLQLRHRDAEAVELHSGH